MQGINKSRHLHLLNALRQLEETLINDRSNLDTSELSSNGVQTVMIPNAMQLMAKRRELEESYKKYLNILDELALHIATYEDLFIEVKVRYLGSSLKYLKRNIHVPTFAAERFVEL
ncbi:hypothetical protein D3C87_183290 [compost metagenome]